MARKKQSKKVKIEIPSFEDDEETKPKKKAGKTPKVEKVREDNRQGNGEVLEIYGKELHIKIPNNLEFVTRVKRILEVYEDELLLEKYREKKISQEEPEEFEEFEEPESLTQAIIQEEVPVPTPTATEEETPKILQEQEIVQVKPYENYVICPLCSGKLKKKRLKRVGDMLVQKVKCKNRKCNFERTYEFSI